MSLKQCRNYLFQAMEMLNEEISYRRDQNHINNLELFCDVHVRKEDQAFYPLKVIAEFFNHTYSSKKYGIELARLGFIRDVKKKNNSLFVGYYMDIVNPIDKAKLDSIRDEIYNRKY